MVELAEPIPEGPWSASSAVALRHTDIARLALSYRFKRMARVRLDFKEAARGLAAEVQVHC
jgi:hypothetical protein